VQLSSTIKDDEIMLDDDDRLINDFDNLRGGERLVLCWKRFVRNYIFATEDFYQSDAKQFLRDDDIALFDALLRSPDSDDEISHETPQLRGKKILRPPPSRPTCIADQLQEQTCARELAGG
jgi:hypothetical protein